MVGIVILNFNSWTETYNCISSIFENESELDYHIYLVDNASKIPMEECIRQLLDEKKKNITYISTEINKGYAAGNNLGIEQALVDNCDELLILNNDVMIMKNSISKLRDYLAINANVGIVGPKVYLSDGNIQSINCGVKMGLREKYMYLLKNTPAKKLVQRFLNSFNAIDNDLSKPFKVYAVSGCCFMMSKQCKEMIMPFDEGTFLYEEENIIGYKMDKIGLDTVYYTDSEIVHFHGQSTKNLKAFSYSCFVESEIYYLKKYLNATNLEVIPLYIIRTLKFLIHCVIYEDYKRNFKFYFQKTLKRLAKA